MSHQRREMFCICRYCWNYSRRLQRKNTQTTILSKLQKKILNKKNHSDSTKKFSETDIINMLECLIDNIFVILGGRDFQQTVGIPMGTNYAALLADLFLYSYQADFIQGHVKKSEKKLARSFNFTLYR